MPFCCTENEGEPVFGEQVTYITLAEYAAGATELDFGLGYPLWHKG